MLDERTLIELRLLSGYHRKPTQWSEVGETVPIQLLIKLKSYHAIELGIENNIAATFNEIPEDPVFLILRRGAVYLVNTEGADYARYVRYIGTLNSHGDLPPHLDQRV